MNELQISRGSGLMSSIVPAGDILAVVEHVQGLVREAMIESIDGDYAVIPGTRKKALLKPGAEKLLMAFGLVSNTRTPQITSLPDNHREVLVETEIRSALTGNLLSVGIGSCSTLESKYRYRPGPVEFTGRSVPPAYWDLRKSRPTEATALLGGKGFVPKKNEQGKYEIARAGETVENPDPADQWNTVLKMAAKRSLIDGTLRATMASAMFTQDMEDFAGEPTRIEIPQEEPAKKIKAKEVKKETIKNGEKTHTETIAPTTDPKRCSATGRLVPAGCQACKLAAKCDDDRNPNRVQRAETAPILCPVGGPAEGEVVTREQCDGCPILKSGPGCIAWPKKENYT